jgi:carbamoyltransferase
MCTQFLGFPHYGDEYKVMGLAPYGKADESIIKKLKDVVLFKSNGLFELNHKYLTRVATGDWVKTIDGIPVIAQKFSDHFVKQFGQPRQKDEELSSYHKDFAASVQRVTEELIFHIAEDLQKKTGLKNLCIAGGVAQNSVANGKITDNTSFERLFVPPAGHDGGTSIGSALYYYHQILDKSRTEAVHQAYTGSSFSNEAIEDFSALLGENSKLSESVMSSAHESLTGGGKVSAAVSALR